MSFYKRKPCADAGAGRSLQQQQIAVVDQESQFAIIVSIPGDAGGLGALEDVLVLLPLGLGCSRDPTQALSTADSPLLSVALLLSATRSRACTVQPAP